MTFSRYFPHPKNVSPYFSTRDFLMTATKITLQAILKRNFLVSEIFIHSYCFSRKGPGRSRYAMIYYITLQYTHAKYYRAYIPYFHFPGRRYGAYRHKKALFVTSINEYLIVRKW